jgi:monoamine oxidase
MSKDPIIVVGAGIAGLAAVYQLIKAGYEVTGNECAERVMAAG